MVISILEMRKLRFTAGSHKCGPSWFKAIVVFPWTIAGIGVVRVGVSAVWAQGRAVSICGGCHFPPTLQPHREKLTEPSRSWQTFYLDLRFFLHPLSECPFHALNLSILCS